MEFKKFRSPKDPIRVSDTSGHTRIIGSELVDVPAILWAQAYASGALSEDMQVSGVSEYIEAKKQEQEAKDLKEREEIKDILREIYKNPVGFVDKNNRPLIRKVIGKVQHPVKKDYIDSVWDELVAEEE